MLVEVGAGVSPALECDKLNGAKGTLSDDTVLPTRRPSLRDMMWQHTARSLAREVVMEHGSSTFCIFAVTSS